MTSQVHQSVIETLAPPGGQLKADPSKSKATTARRVVRFLGLLAGAVGGLEYAIFIQSQAALDAGSTARVFLLCSIAGAIFGFFGLEYVTLKPFRWMESKLRVTPLPDLASAIGGLAVALLMAALIGFFLRDLPYGLNIVVGSALAILFGYWGVSIGLGRRDEILALLRGQPLEKATRTLLDTSVIIDGRVVDIARTGFITAKLIAPHFVLTELQQVADSAEAVRRQRGRRGLEILQELKTMPEVTIDFVEDDYPGVMEVDNKLIKLARRLGASILTNDYNLNRVAQLEGIPVLNINDLSNALKPAVVPGEELVVTPLKEGKEHNQGVGYLTDGTMVVVEGGRGRIGQPSRVTVTSVIQTAAGRMIFAATGGAPGVVAAPPASMAPPVAILPSSTVGGSES